MNTKECWTAAELQAECRRISELISHRAELSVNISNYAYGKTVCRVTVYPFGIVGPSGSSKSFQGASFAEALGEAEKYAAGARDELQIAVIRRMALAVIDITDRLGGCSDSNLRTGGFTPDEITSYHIEACDAASRMSGNSPFVVMMSVSAAA